MATKTLRGVVLRTLPALLATLLSLLATPQPLTSATAAGHPMTATTARHAPGVQVPVAHASLAHGSIAPPAAAATAVADAPHTASVLSRPAAGEPPAELPLALSAQAVAGVRGSRAPPSVA